jgi:hypothetical protein
VPLSEAEMNNDEELREQHGLFISTWMYLNPSFC